MTALAHPHGGAYAQAAKPGLGIAFAFLLAGAVLGLLGRSTMIPGTDLAALWPAAGVAVVWLLVRQAGPLSIDTALLGGAMFALGIASGMPLWLALSLPVTHLLQTVIVVELMRRALPELWGCGGTEAIDTPRRLARYLGCVAAGVLVATVVGVSWWRLAGEEADLPLALLWFGRNACGVLVVATALLLLMQYLDQSPPRRPQWAGSWLEFAAACATSAALYGLVFLGDVHSMLFLLLGVVIWFGVRFGTLTNALHTVIVAHLAVAATLADRGPFAHEGKVENVLLVQLFVLASAITGLALSTGLDERTGLTAELRQTSKEMTYQAQLLNAVVNSMAEGLVVVDDAGRWLLRNPAATRVGGLAGDLRNLLSSGSGADDPLSLALAGQTVRDRELVVAGPPGAGRILAVSAAPLPHDSVTGRARALLIFRDATSSTPGAWT